MAIDMDNSFIEIDGELVYCKKSATGMYHSGIKFVGSNEKVINSSIKLIKENNHQKNNLLNTVE